MHKQLFNLRVGQILVRQEKHTSLTLDFIKILDKYDMTVFLENYLLGGFFPVKSLWRKIVNQSIDIYENTGGIYAYGIVQICTHTYIVIVCYNIQLLRLAVVYPNKNLKLIILVKLGSMAIKSGQCTLCNTFTHDLSKHLVLQCQTLLHIRNSLFYTIVDILSVEK
jgi:hypothetical protein